MQNAYIHKIAKNYCDTLTPTLAITLTLLSFRIYTTYSAFYQSPRPNGCSADYRQCAYATSTAHMRTTGQTMATFTNYNSRKYALSNNAIIIQIIHSILYKTKLP